MALLPHPADEDEVTVETRDLFPSHLLFKIESFSLLSKHGIDKYESSEFESSDYKWKLILYPKRRKTETETETEDGTDHISVFLAVSETSSLPACWEVNAVFSIFLFNHKLDNFLSVRGRVRRFHTLKPEWGFSKFIQMETLTNPSNGYLVDDTCVFGAEVFVIKNKGTKECLSLLKVTDSFKREFKISKFSGVGDIWDSEEFEAGDHKWKLSMYPKGNGEEKGRSVSVFLQRIDLERHSSCKKIKADFYVRIKNQPIDGEHCKNGGSSWFSTFRVSLGCSRFISMVDMNDPKKGFVVKDCCIIEVKISIQAGVR
ncbi:TRAF-like family protein [Abeliophyllum distichum]|uniref:TRAF-like family protein n=1 Tax=Abeliophyllum distichum TaxID=126358 RepID=A0ABD1Q3L3_9LAMI